MDREDDYGLAFTELVRYCGEMLGKCSTQREIATCMGLIVVLHCCLAYSVEEIDEATYTQGWLDAVTHFTVSDLNTPAISLLREKITSLQQEYKI